MVLLPISNMSFALVSSSGGEGFDPLKYNDASNTLWTVVIFAAAVGLMWGVVWKPMAQHLEERDHKAEDAAKAAEAAKAAAERAEAEVRRKLDEAQRESARIITDARAAGEAQGREAIAAAQAQAQQQLERAKADIEREKAKALSEIRETVVEISLDAATRVVGRAVTDDDQRRYVRDFVTSRETR